MSRRERMRSPCRIVDLVLMPAESIFGPVVCGC